MLAPSAGQCAGRSLDGVCACANRCKMMAIWARNGLEIGVVVPIYKMPAYPGSEWLAAKRALKNLMAVLMTLFGPFHHP